MKSLNPCSAGQSWRCFAGPRARVGRRMETSVRARPSQDNQRSYNGHYMKVGMHAEEIVMAWLNEHPIAGGFAPRQSIVKLTGWACLSSCTVDFPNHSTNTSFQSQILAGVFDSHALPPFFFVNSALPR